MLLEGSSPALHGSLNLRDICRLPSWPALRDGGGSGTRFPDDSGGHTGFGPSDADIGGDFHVSLFCTSDSPICGVYGDMAVEAAMSAGHCGAIRIAWDGRVARLSSQMGVAKLI